MSTVLGLKAIELAKSAVGVREQPLGSNDGPEVKKYLSSVNLPVGNPWCQAFAFYQFQNAAHQLGLSSLDYPKTGSTTVVGQWAKANGKIITNPVPGCIFLVPKPNVPGEFHHVGLVSDVLPDGTFISIEGNSNSGGSPEGVGVFSNRRRRLNLVFALIS